MAKITFLLKNTNNIEVFVDGVKKDTINEKSKSFILSKGKYNFLLKRGLFNRNLIIDLQDNNEEIKYIVSQTNVIKKILSFRFTSTVYGIVGVFGALVIGNVLGLNKQSDILEWVAVMLGFFAILFLISWILGKRIKIEKVE